jgi:hypothetical protein
VFASPVGATENTTGPSVAVAQFILFFGCQLPYFENNQKPV